jgi:hypothetical protein
LVGVAVNVTDVPEQIVVCVAEILTPGVTLLLTVIAISLETAFAGVAHVVLLVITTVTLSLLERLLLVNIELFVPVLTPFTLH